MSSPDEKTSQRHGFFDADGPLVSVIIPTYNHASFLAEAIESVLRQLYSHFEIIVVDDGSTDSTRKVAARFEDQIRYIWQQNQGLSAARNTGLRVADGTIIALLDADDLYEPSFLSTLVGILVQNPQLDGVYCAAQTVDVTNRALPQQIGKVVQPDAFHATLLEGGFFPPLCMVAYKYCYDRLERPFDESLAACEDWDMWLRFSTRYVIQGIDEPLVRYRVVPGSMSRDPERMITNRAAVLRKHFDQELKQQPENEVVFRRASARSHLRGAIEHLQAGNGEQAFTNIQLAALYCPELLTELETFYLLGQGAQPMGFRGDFGSLDLDHNVLLLEGMLDRLFDNDEAAGILRPYRRIAYGNAFMAMGFLSYGARRFKLARTLLLRAAARNSAVLFQRQYTALLIKTVLGPRMLNGMKRFRESRKSNIPMGR